MTNDPGRPAEHLRRTRARLEAWARPRLRSVLERMSVGSVVVTEYPVEPDHRWGWDRPPHAELESMFGEHRDRYRAELDGFVRHLPALRLLPRHSNDQRTPQWENDYFAGLDAVALYSFVVDRKPERYVEVGSGFSTRFARCAIDACGAPTTICSIDPAPRAEVVGLCDEVHRVGLQDAPTTAFDGLGPGDIVLIDGSHVAAMGSDVVVAFTEVLPRFAPGVLVGIDDVFLPWDYPPTWVGRWYAEQYLLAMLLLSRDPSWRVVLPAWWATHDAELAPLVEQFSDPARSRGGTTGKTFWMERRAPSDERT